MSDFASPSAIKAGVDAIEQEYEHFVAITRERLETVYPAAATGLDQVASLRKRTIDSVLNAGRTASHGWEDFGAKLAANQQAVMDGFLAMTQSWLGGGASEAVEEELAAMRGRMASELEAMTQSAATMQRQQADALKSASDGIAAELAAAKSAHDSVAAEATAAKAEAANAKADAAAAAAAVTALGQTIEATTEAKIAALRGALDAEIARLVESRVEAARAEIERETDQDVDAKLATLKMGVDEKLTALAEALAADVAGMRSQIASLAKEKSAKPAKSAAAKRKPAKTTRKAGA
ncbi:MAG TPA: hypothetical protein VM325_16985 [Alphaproteobacteria bacterium]|nr:hypothetical protein [Alphaproteobacteria bacterium]